MSEATKEEAEEAQESQPAAAAAPLSESRAEAFPPEVLRLLRRVVPAAWLLAVIVGWAISGIAVGFLIAAAGALTLVITLMWTSVQSLTGGTALGFEEALGMGAPSKVEEEKRAVLRALKDLEFERSVGKITPEDYAELVAQYRAQAKRLIQSVDDTLAPARQEVEKAIAARLERARLGSEIPQKTAENTEQAPAPSVEEAAEDEETLGEASSDEPARDADEQPAPPSAKTTSTEHES